MLEYDLDKSFAALADPTRRALVDRLSRGPASVSDLAAPFPVSLAAVMQHLKVLEDARLVTSTKQGRVRTCRVDPAMLGLVERWVADRRAMWEARLDRLEKFLDDEEEGSTP
jgi:DNA-binding transcriptional ArsR family regulator